MFASFNARAVGLPELGPFETIEIAAEAGFQGVDLMVRDIVDSGVNLTTLRNQIEGSGLIAGAFPFPLDWRKCEETYRRDLNRLPWILEAAEALGFHRTGTWVMPETADPFPSRRETAALHDRRLGELGRLFRDRGIRIGLEVIGVESFRTGRGEPFITRLEDLVRELETLWKESDQFGILLDGFHLYAANESIEAGLRWGIDRVIWVHVADLPPDSDPVRSRIIDGNRGLPGENGAVDLRGFLSRLNREGYEGPVTVEPLANCRSLQGLKPLEIARRVQASLVGVWPE